MIFETCILPYYYSIVCIMITGGRDLAHGGLTSRYWVGVFKESINFYPQQVWVDCVILGSMGEDA